MDNLDQIEPFPRPTGNNISCNEVLTVLDEHWLPISDELRDLMDREDITQFAQVSGLIMRTAVIDEASGSPSSHIFELNSNRLEEDVTEFIDTNAEGSDDDKQALLELEMAEIDSNQTLADLYSPESSNASPAFYDFSVLLRPVAFSSEGASLLWKILRSTVHPEHNSEHHFSYDKTSKVRWDKGLGFEKYFTEVLLEDQHQPKSDTNSIVYQDSGIPLFYRLPNVNADNTENRYDGSIALSLQDITVNGIFVPSGTLVGIESEIISENSETRVLSTDSIKSVFPLRLSLFSLPPSEARVSFGDLYREYERNKSVVPTLENFKQVAAAIAQSN